MYAINLNCLLVSFFSQLFTLLYIDMKLLISKVSEKFRPTVYVDSLVSSKPRSLSMLDVVRPKASLMFHEGQHFINWTFAYFFVSGECNDQRQSKCHLPTCVSGIVNKFTRKRAYMKNVTCINHPCPFFYMSFNFALIEPSHIF